MRDEQVELRLRAWAEIPLPPALAARTLSRAQAALQAGEGRRAGRAAIIAATAAVVSAVAIYLAWAVEFLSALARG